MLSGPEVFIFHSNIPRPKRDDVIQEFSTVDSPAALVLTPAPGGRFPSEVSEAFKIGKKE